MAQEVDSQQTEVGRKVCPQHMRDTQLVVSMRFLQKAKIPLKPIFALPFLHFGLHSTYVCRQCEGLSIVEPDIVVRLALEQSDTLGF